MPHFSVALARRHFQSFGVKFESVYCLDSNSVTCSMCILSSFEYRINKNLTWNNKYLYKPDSLLKGQTKAGDRAPSGASNVAEVLHILFSLHVTYHLMRKPCATLFQILKQNVDVWL